MGVEASVIIDFEDRSSEDASGTVLVEIDDAYPDNLDADGNIKSPFLPEDRPVFLIHHDSTVEVIGVKCTDGRVDQLSESVNYRTRSFDGVFTAVDKEISLSYYNATDLVATWFGNIGSIRIEDMAVVADGGDFPCYCNATFSVPFNQRWRLSPPPLDLADDETYTIYVVVYVRTIA